MLRFEAHANDTNLLAEPGTSLIHVERRELATTSVWMLALDQEYSEFYALARLEPKLVKMKACLD
jgi:hypothetical protein